MNKQNNFFRQIWPEIRWIVTGALWLTSFLLGYAGFSSYSTDNGLNLSITEKIYRSLQLFILESGALTGKNNWMMEIARFILPTLTAYTALQAISHLFKEQTQLLQLWWLKDHIIVCGLGRKGTYLVNDCLSKGMKVLVIEKNIDPVSANTYRQRGALVFESDATDPDILMRARLSRASHLICLLGDDQQNLLIAHHAYHAVKNLNRKKLICIVHLSSQDLLNLVKRSELNLSINDPFLFETFNTYRLAAHQIIQMDPRWHKSSPEYPSNIIVIGLGRLGENLILQASYRYYKHHPTRKLNIWVIDLQADEKTRQLIQRNSQLESVTCIMPVQVDLSSNALLNDKLKTNLDLESIQTVYLCLGNPILSLQAYLTLRQRPELADVPFRIRLSNQSGLVELFENPITGQHNHHHLMIFDMHELTCSAGLVVGGLHEILSRQLRENYLLSQSSPEALALLQIPWEDVSEEEKAANRQQANRICHLLNSCDYTISPLENWDAGEFTFPDTEVARLAEEEHSLWCQWKLNNGWCYGENRNDSEKTHPGLVSWEQLPELERRKNLDFICKAPGLLAEIGFQIEKVNRNF